MEFKSVKVYNCHMGSEIIKSGISENGFNYKIYNIDNTYTVYFQIETETNNSEDSEKTIYSAVESFPTLKKAEKFVKEYSKN